MTSSGLADFPPRRYSARPLPVYRHNPGHTPHPVVDEAGHSYVRDTSPSAADALTGLRWLRCEPYLYGVDLFNETFFWEAHESWEPLWHRAGHRTAPGLFVQGLIQVTASLLLKRCERPQAVPQLLERAERNLYQAVAVSPELTERWAFGIDLARWLPLLRAWVGDETERFPFIELQT